MTKSLWTTSLTPELYCSNIGISLSFYIDILGFKIQYQRVDEVFAMLERQGSRIMLDEIRDEIKSMWISAPLTPPFGRGMKTNYVDTLYNYCITSGATIFFTYRG